MRTVSQTSSIMSTTMSPSVVVAEQHRSDEKSVYFLHLTVRTLVLKPSFSQRLSIRSHPCLAQADLLEFDHSVFGSHIAIGLGSSSACVRYLRGYHLQQTAPSRVASSTEQ